MIVLIDAYNLIKRVVCKSELSDNEIKHFQNKLRNYAKSSGNSVILVFDGGFNTFTTVSREKNYEIVYAGYGKIADDVIKKYLNDLNPDNTVLVTSDSDIVKYAKERDFEHIKSIDFYKDYLTAKIEKSEIKKPTSDFIKINNSSGDFDELMKMYSKKISTKIEDLQVKKPESGRVAKKDKKRDKILKKL